MQEVGRGSWTASGFWLDTGNGMKCLSDTSCLIVCAHPVFWSREGSTAASDLLSDPSEGQSPRILEAQCQQYMMHWPSVVQHMQNLHHMYELLEQHQLLEQLAQFTACML